MQALQMLRGERFFHFMGSAGLFIGDAGFCELFAFACVFCTR